jgi:hypothetical protein
VGPKTDRPERELEGRLPPLSSLPSLFGYVAAKKVMAPNYHHLFLFSYVATKKATIAVVVVFFFFFFQIRKRQ